MSSSSVWSSSLTAPPTTRRSLDGRLSRVVHYVVLKLLLKDGRIFLTVGGRAGAVDDLGVVGLAEDPVLVDAELLAGGELPLARVAGEAGQVVDLLLGLPHPVRRRDRPAALEALRTEQPAKIPGQVLEFSQSARAFRCFCCVVGICKWLSPFPRKKAATY